jgi:hypothetical protein
MPEIDHFARGPLGRLLRPAALCRFQGASVALLQQRAPTGAARLALVLWSQTTLIDTRGGWLCSRRSRARVLSLTLPAGGPSHAFVIGQGRADGVVADLKDPAKGRIFSLSDASAAHELTALDWSAAVCLAGQY